MISEFVKVVRFEMKHLVRDKKALLLIFLIPIFYLTIFGNFYSNNILKETPITIVDYDKSQLSRTLINSFDKSERFDVKSVVSNELGIEEGLKEREIEAYVVIPGDFSKRLKKGENTDVLLAVDTTNVMISNTLQSYGYKIVKTVSAGVNIKKFTKKGMAEEIAYDNALPLNFIYSTWYNVSYNFNNYFLIGIIALVVHQVLIMYVSNSLNRFKARKHFEEYLNFSKNPFVLILGKAFPYCLFMFINVFISTIYVVNAFDVSMFGDFFNLYLMMVPLLIACLSIGVMISIFTNTEAESTQMTMALSYPVFLISGYSWPISSMPDLLKTVGKFVPFTYVGNNFRDIFLMGKETIYLINDFYISLALSVVYLVIAVILFNRKYLKEIHN